jgi:type I restriction enzyme M protein
LIDAIIALPPELFYGTGIPACLMVLDKNKPTHKKNKIIFINASYEYEEGVNKNFLRKKDIKKIIDAYEDYKEITIPKNTNKYNKHFSRIVDLDEIKTNDSKLSIVLYADASPPPEMYSTKHILHSGIPKEEIFDDYIKEKLQDFKIEKVLETKDNHTYYFKDKIEKKENLRYFLDTTDKDIISIFERWWDKYKFSYLDLNKDFETLNKEMIEFYEKFEDN